MSRRSALLKVFLLLALLSAAAVNAYAIPDPGQIDDMRREADRIAAEIDALDLELAIATEQYNAIQHEINELNERIIKNEGELGKLKYELETRSDVLNSRLRRMYKNGNTSPIEVLVGSTSLSDFLNRMDYFSTITAEDSKAIRALDESRNRYEDIRASLDEDQSRKKTLAYSMINQRTQIEAGLQHRRAILDNLNEEILEILAEYSIMNPDSSNPIQIPIPEGGFRADPRGPHYTALQFIGVPYHYASPGPGRCPSGAHTICFDCSGLTQYVYALHGWRIPHHSKLQYNSMRKVPASEKQPGDLVLFGSSLHHVGIYLGNDQYIHAPRTGDVVRVNSLSSRRDVAGFCRM